MGSFAPNMCVDHGQLTKMINIQYDFDSLVRSELGEDFCRRTMASPHESYFSNLAKNHIAIRFHLLHHFASQFHGTDIWKEARDATAKVVVGKKRARFFRKK